MIELETLDKGQHIEARQIEEHAGVSQTSEHYRMKQLAIMQWIERELALRGNPVTVKCRGKGLHILDDSAASKHNHKEFRVGERRMRRRARKMAEVDTSGLTPDEQRTHEEASITQSRKLQALNLVTRQEAARRARQAALNGEAQ